MEVTVKNVPLRGETVAVPSKSISHRALILRALAGGGSIENLGCGDDISATKECIEAMPERRAMNARASATTLRLLLPIALAKYGEARFVCEGRLAERPLAPYEECIDAKFVREGSKLTVTGRLKPGKYRLRGDVSSQFVSGLMLALPLVSGESEIVLTTPLESEGYAEMTRRMMADAGVTVEKTAAGFAVHPGVYSPRDVTVEGDWSYAANFLAGNTLGSSVTVTGLNTDSMQGDSGIKELLCKSEVDVKNCVDIFPALAAAAAGREGTTLLFGAARLRIKESDRLSAMATELERLGARVKSGADWLEITGQEIRGGRVETYGDHRIAMALSMLAPRANSPIIISGAECAGKSAPRFFDEIKRLSGGM